MENIFNRLLVSKIAPDDESPTLHWQSIPFLFQESRNPWFHPTFSTRKKRIKATPYQHPGFPHVSPKAPRRQQGQLQSTRTYNTPCLISPKFSPPPKKKNIKKKKTIPKNLQRLKKKSTNTLPPKKKCPPGFDLVKSFPSFFANRGACSPRVFVTRVCTVGPFWGGRMWSRSCFQMEEVKPRIFVESFSDTKNAGWFFADYYNLNFASSFSFSSFQAISPLPKKSFDPWTFKEFLSFDEKGSELPRDAFKLLPGEAAAGSDRVLPRGEPERLGRAGGQKQGTHFSKKMNQPTNQPTNQPPNPTQPNPTQPNLCSLLIYTPIPYKMRLGFILIVNLYVTPANPARFLVLSHVKCAWASSWL